MVSNVSAVVTTRYAADAEPATMAHVAPSSITATRAGSASYSAGRGNTANDGRVPANTLRPRASTTSYAPSGARCVRPYVRAGLDPASYTTASSTRPPNTSCVPSAVANRVVRTAVPVAASTAASSVAPSSVALTIEPSSRSVTARTSSVPVASTVTEISVRGADHRRRPRTDATTVLVPGSARRRAGTCTSLGTISSFATIATVAPTLARETPSAFRAHTEPSGTSTSSVCVSPSTTTGGVARTAYASLASRVSVARTCATRRTGPVADTVPETLSSSVSLATSTSAFPVTSTSAPSSPSIANRTSCTVTSPRVATSDAAPYSTNTRRTGAMRSYHGANTTSIVATHGGPATSVAVTYRATAPPTG